MMKHVPIPLPIMVRPPGRALPHPEEIGLDTRQIPGCAGRVVLMIQMDGDIEGEFAGIHLSHKVGQMHHFLIITGKVKRHIAFIVDAKGTGSFCITANGAAGLPGE